MAYVHILLPFADDEAALFLLNLASCCFRKTSALRSTREEQSVARGAADADEGSLLMLTRQG